MTTGSRKRGVAERAASPQFNRFMQLLDGIDYASRGLIILCMAIMTGLVSTQVFSRYVLGFSIDWAEEMSRLFFVWSIFLAIPHGIRTGIHVGIDVLVSRLGTGIQTNLFRANAALAAALFGLVFAQSLFAAAASWGEMMPTLDVTSSVFYIAVVIAAGHSFLHMIPLALYGPQLVEPHQIEEGAPE